MLEVWGRRNSINVQKVLWCCEELGLSYRLINAGGTFGRTDEPQYLAMNPTGLVPTLVDNNTVVWESNAIVRYLSYYYGQNVLWPVDRRAYARAEAWMNWQPTVWQSLRPAFIGLIRRPQHQRDPTAIGNCLKQTADQLHLLDCHLMEHDYVAGSLFSMGDIPLGVTVNRWLKLDEERPSMPNIEAWEGRLRGRAAYARMVASLPLS